MPWTNPETFTAGQTLTAASMNAISGNLTFLPRGLTAYAQTSTPQGSITGVTDLTSLSVTFTAEANRYYLIHGFVTAYSSVGSDGFGVIIANAASIALATAHALSRDNLAGYGASAFVRVAPGAGSVTYKLRSSRSGSGTLTYQPDGVTPSFIMVTDIGPA